MMVFWKARLAFLEVPKTASTALSTVLDPAADFVIRHPPELRHSTVYRYERWLRPFFEKAGKTELETVAVIREPMDWLKSWYRYRQRDDVKRTPNSTANMEFNQFFEGYLQPKGKIPDYSRVGSQGRFLENKEGGLGVDYLFQYEQLPKLVLFLEERLQRTLDLPTMNTSPAAKVSIDPALMAQHILQFEQDYQFWEGAAK